MMDDFRLMINSCKILFFRKRRSEAFSGLVLLMFFAASCTPQKVTSQTDTVPKNQQNEIIEVVEDTIPEEVQIQEPVPDTFDIALILPFYLDSVQRIPDTVEVNYPDQSEMAIEFYNGIRFALDSLDKTGFRARIHVYDDANDKGRIKKIMQQPDFKQMDLLLGPVFNNNLRIMAEYAKQDSIHLVSPLSPATKITSYNPYYIMVNPSIARHCWKLFVYIIRHHQGDNILLFTRPNSVESEYAAIFQKYLAEYQADATNPLLPVHFTEVKYAPDKSSEKSEDSDYNSLSGYFFETKENVVIVPSVDKAYIHNVGRSLYQLVEPPAEEEDPIEYKITVMGLPPWGEQEGTRFDYVQKLNVHFTSTYYVDTNFYNMKNPFYKAYVKEFKTEPSEHVIKGFDLMLYFGTILNVYGNQFGSMIMLADAQAKAIHTNFNFGIHQAETDTTATNDSIPAVPVTDFIENKYVHLLKYDGYSVVKVE